MLQWNRASRFWLYFLLLTGALAMIFPFVWMFLSAFKTDADIYAYPPRWLPSHWRVENFIDVFRIIPFARYYLNSVFVTSMITLGQLLLSILAAYSFARLRFPLKSTIFILAIATLIMPFEVLMIPTFIIVHRLGWLDTYQGLIVPFLFNGFSIFFLKQFFEAVPKDLEDAAKIDGCGYLGILIHVILPNTKPAVGTITLFTFLTHWRSYIWPLIITNTTRMRTLPIGLKYFIGEGGEQYHLMMAAACMAILPVLVVYIVAERQFVKSMTFTGLKR
ncbi:MAG: carbohydrate ABC transporter permease [Thermoplasmata archaeon]|nr:MAG: carbohydrate ABC transporter permease [Thermoplasmata archaeon]